MSFDYHDESFRHKILKIGDIARFKKIENSIKHKDYIGIVVKMGEPCSDGEITYEVLCSDSIIRLFFDYETDESISST